MPSTLDRWLLGRFVRAYLLFLAASFALFGVIDLFSNVERLRNRGKALADAGGLQQALLERYGTMLPELFFMLSPHFVLLAGLWTIVALIRAGELVPLLAAGYAPRRVAAPLLLAAGLLGALAWADRELLMPRLAHLRRTRELKGLETPRDVPDGRGGVLSARYYDVSQRLLVQARFIRQTAAGGEASVLIAQEARYEAGSGGWRFARGLRIERAPEGDVVSSFGSDGVLVPSQILPSDVEASIEAPTYLSSAQLAAQLERTPGFRHLEVLLYERYTQAAAGLALLLTALPLALGGVHSGLYGRVLAGIGLGVAYFLLTTVLFELANRGAVAPALAALLPPLGFGAIGMVVFAARG